MKRKKKLLLSSRVGHEFKHRLHESKDLITVLLPEQGSCTGAGKLSTIFRNVHKLICKRKSDVHRKGIISGVVNASD